MAVEDEAEDLKNLGGCFVSLEFHPLWWSQLKGTGMM